MNKHKTKYIVSVISTVFLSILCVQAWNGLTASPGDKLDYQKWNELVASVQSGRIPGEVAAFNLSTCPTGWSPYNDAIGRTIIGVGNGAGSNTTLGNTGGEKSGPSLEAYMNISSSNGNLSTPPSGLVYLGGLLFEDNGAGANMQGPYSTSTPSGSTKIPVTITGGGSAPDNMQPYVALLYCVKN